MISIHALREEGDYFTSCLPSPQKDFYPRPPRGGRPQPAKACCRVGRRFLSTPSARRATVRCDAPARGSADFYPRPPRGGRHASMAFSLPNVTISIHALREEGDDVPRDGFCNAVKFLSTPSARRATQTSVSKQSSTKFLSTPSARRATRLDETKIENIINFYPRLPRGGRQHSMDGAKRRRDISIHALREEGDLTASCSTRVSIHGFLSTPSARRATRPAAIHSQRGRISIHALREEGDSRRGAASDCKGISIHALREEGDVYSVRSHLGRQRISIHALREEGDLKCSQMILHGTLFLSTPSARRATCAVAASRAHPADFYPRPPRGGRRPEGADAAPRLGGGFLSTPSARRATMLCRSANSATLNFYPRPPRGGRPDIDPERAVILEFLSTPSARRATAL